MTEAMRVEAASCEQGRAALHADQSPLSGFFCHCAQRLAGQGQLRVCFLAPGRGAAIADADRGGACRSLVGAQDRL